MQTFMVGRPGQPARQETVVFAEGPSRTQNPYGRAGRESASATKSTYPAPDTCIGPRTAGGRHATPAESWSRKVAPPRAAAKRVSDHTPQTAVGFELRRAETGSAGSA